MDYKNGIRSHLAWGDGEADIKEYWIFLIAIVFLGILCWNIQIVNTFWSLLRFMRKHIIS